MPKIIETEVPLDALSVGYLKEGAFVDCYYIDIPKEVTLEQYIQAFYTTFLFKVERSVLSLVTFTLAKDSEAVDLSLGKTERYSIWTVEKRKSDQILLCEFTENTRSWLSVKVIKVEGVITTRLYFGSVVIPKSVSENGEGNFGFIFHLLGKFHKVYSKSLLNAAYKKLILD